MFAKYWATIQSIGPKFPSLQETSRRRNILSYKVLGLGKVSGQVLGHNWMGYPPFKNVHFSAEIPGFFKVLGHNSRTRQRIAHSFSAFFNPFSVFSLLGIYPCQAGRREPRAQPSAALGEERFKWSVVEPARLCRRL